MILESIIKLISDCQNVSINSGAGTIYCNGWTVSDKAIIQQLDDANCFEQSIYIEDIQIGQTIDLELSAANLCKLGFYDSCKRFVLKNKYEYPAESFYINDIKASNTGISNSFICRFKGVLGYSKALESVAKHSFEESNIKSIVLSSEKYSVVLSLDYSAEDIKSLTDEQLSKINMISDTINGEKNEKRNLFINEIIEFINNKSISTISSILSETHTLYNNCEAAYLFYISNYTSNKLKFEINSKALEYTQRIQTVINEAQSRLIAIPSAFVLAALTMEYDSNKLAFSAKNIVTIISLFVFSLLIQLFLSNQKNTLEIIGQDISEFKDTFKQPKLLTEKFKCVDDSLQKQKRRLKTITWILWGIPVLGLLYFIGSNFVL